MSNPVGNSPNPVQQETQSWAITNWARSLGSYINPLPKLATLVDFVTASSTDQSPSLDGRDISAEATDSPVTPVAASALPVASAAPEDLTAVSAGIVAPVPQMVEASEAGAVEAPTTTPPVEEDAPQASEAPKSEPNCIMKFLNLLLWLITFGQCGNEEKINETPQN